MPIDILMPALSPTMEEGTLAKWHVKVGQEVRSGDVLCEIETDKATMEVEAVDEGKLIEILVADGTQGVKVNAVIARLEGEGGLAAPPPVATPVAAPAPATPAAAAPSAAEVEPAVSPPSSAGHEGGPRVFASPLARRLAAQAGLDLSSVAGTGPNGRIVKADVEAAQGRAPTSSAGPVEPVVAPLSPPVAAASGAASRAAPSAEPNAHPYAPGSYDLVPLDGMRRTIARRMTDSFRDVPHFPLQIDIEIDALLKLRAQLNAAAEADGVKVSVNDLIVKAAALACRRVPAANASYTPDGLLLHHHADIAVAVAIEGGLVTPVIRQAETKGLAAISREMKALAEKARARKLMPEDYSGGTFSISNLGMMGIKSFASILNAPQGCILSVGAGEQRPVVKGGALAVATIMSVTLTCDHRVVDGAVGASWLSAFRRLCEEPVGLML